MEPSSFFTSYQKHKLFVNEFRSLNIGYKYTRVHKSVAFICGVLFIKVLACSFYRFFLQ